MNATQFRWSARWWWVVLSQRTLRLAFVFFVLTAVCSSQPGSPSAGTAWTVFRDPAENAFQIAVPQGWRITGGLYRLAPLDPRFMVDMVSPDGKTDIRVGDYRVPRFATLTRTLWGLGFREGSSYNRQTIADYRPGWVFADVYGQGRFSGVCSKLRLKSMQRQTPVHSDQGFAATTAGDVVYACEAPGGMQVAYVFAETQLTQMQSSGSWSVNWLHSFVTPQSQAAQTIKILFHALSTFEIRPEWFRRQLEINHQSSEATMRAFEQNMSAIRADYERRTAASQSQFDSMDRALRGVDLVTDAVDGKPREVWVGTGGRHWENGMGDIVNAPSQPAGNFKETKP